MKKRKTAAKKKRVGRGRPSLGDRVSIHFILPPKLLDRLTREAIKKGVSRNALMVEILESYRG
jgi:hypothetical protein